MENFIFQNPTKLVFGKGTIARLGELIPAGKRVMVTFGGGSVRRNGVYDEVCAALEGCGLHCEQVVEKNGWVCLVCRRA